MALVADRVKDTSTTTGTGNFTLAGSPPSGFESFNTAFGVGPSFHYVIDGGSEWEIGTGHLSGATTLVRDTVLQSSNADAAVNFSAGTKIVFCDGPAFLLNQIELPQLAPATSLVIPAGRSVYVSRSYEAASGQTLEVGAGAVFEAG